MKPFSNKYALFTRVNRISITASREYKNLKAAMETPSSDVTEKPKFPARLAFIERNSREEMKCIRDTWLSVKQRRFEKFRRFHDSLRTQSKNKPIRYTKTSRKEHMIRVLAWQMKQARLMDMYKNPPPALLQWRSTVDKGEEECQSRNIMEPDAEIPFLYHDRGLLALRHLRGNEVFLEREATALEKLSELRLEPEPVSTDEPMSYDRPNSNIAISNENEDTPPTVYPIEIFGHQYE